MAQALYRKWRPQTFDDVVGQQHIVRTLRNALRDDHVHHAYLFAGPRGTGKTTTARLIAKAVNCLAPIEDRPCNECEICQAVAEGRLMDLIEIDAASNTGVDNIRDLLEKVGFRPTQGRYKVYVVDEVHMLSTAAFNALLKTLEEPPEHVIFVLATTEAHKIPATVLSRCQRFEFRRIALDDIIARLRQITEEEGYQVEPAALDLIARTATGSMRDAISLLDQMAAEGEVTADYVRLMLGAERREVVHSLIQAWLSRDTQQGLDIINQAVDGGADPRQLARQVSDFLRGLLLMRLGTGNAWTDPTEEERPRFQEMARQAEPGRLVEAVKLFSEVASQRTSGWQPQLPLELAFVEAALERAPQPAAAPVETTRQSTSTPAAQRRPAHRRTAQSTQSAQQVRETKSSAQPAAQPTASVQPAAPVKATASADGSLPVAEIEDRWRDVLREMRKMDNLRSLAALLHDAQPAGVDATGRLVLGFRHAFHQKKVSTETNRALAEEFLSRLFSRSIPIRCELEKDVAGVLANPEPASKPAASVASANTPKPSVPPPPEPPSEVGEDELVQRATQELGAKVKE